MKIIVITIALLLASSVAAEPWYYRAPKGNPDKVEHYWGSYFLSQVSSPEKALAAGIVWEIKQKLQGGEFGEKDLLLDLLGSYRFGYVTFSAREERWTFNVRIPL